MPKCPPITGRFKKGTSGNPKGSSARSKQLKQIKSLSIKEVAEVGSLLLEGTREDLHRLAESPEKSFLQVWTAALMLKGYDEGSPQIYSVIMDRIIGKPKEQREISGPDSGPIMMSDATSDEQKIERAEALRRLRLHIKD